MDGTVFRHTIFVHIFGINLPVERERFVDKKMFSLTLKRPGNTNPTSVASKKVVNDHKSQFQELGSIRLRRESSLLITVG